MAVQAYTYADTGLQSFLDASPAYALAPIGLGSLQKEAQKLAEYGRNGDIYVVHAAEGETVVPMEVLDANPKVKALLFNQMRDMGLDPRRYVVGDELNSLNPVTGAPEFFYTKLFDAAKSVGGFLKGVGTSALGALGRAPEFLGGAYEAITSPGVLEDVLSEAGRTRARGGSSRDALISGGLGGLGRGIDEYFGLDGTQVAGDTDFNLDDYGVIQERQPTYRDLIMRSAYPGQRRTTSGGLSSASGGLSSEDMKKRAIDAAKPVATWEEIRDRTEIDPTDRKLARTGGILPRTGTAPRTGGGIMGRVQDALKRKERTFLDRILGRDATDPAAQKLEAILSDMGTSADDLAPGEYAKMYDKVAESLKPSTGENLLKYGIPGIAALYGLGAFDTPDYEGPTERDRERAHARYARNPYLFPERQGDETPEQFASRKEGYEKEFLLPQEALDPYRFVTRDQDKPLTLAGGGYAKLPKYQDGGLVEPDITRYLRSLDERNIPRVTGFVGGRKPTDLSGITGNVLWHHMPDPAVEDPATNPFPHGVFYRPGNQFMPGGVFTRTRPFETYVPGVSTPYEVQRGTLGSISSEDRGEGTPWGSKGLTYGEYHSPMAQARRGGWPVGQYQEYVIRSGIPRHRADEMFQATEPSWRNIGPMEQRMPGGVFDISPPMRTPPTGPGMGVASQMQMMKPIGKFLNLSNVPGFAAPDYSGLIDTDVFTRGIEPVPYSETTDAGAAATAAGITPENLNRFWNPQVAAGESEADYATRLAGMRSPYAFDEASLNPYAFSDDPSGNLNTGIGAALIPDPNFSREPAPERTPVTAADTAFSGQALDPYFFSKGGALAQFPRRELLVEGPGTERSDDIPAMLSDGEFVINARAVRGADPTGKGDRYRGAQNLYDMMRNFEMRV